MLALSITSDTPAVLSPPSTPSRYTQVTPRKPLTEEGTKKDQKAGFFASFVLYSCLISRFTRLNPLQNDALSHCF
jgi:hypothetical protein